jgi:hypothetical protein
VIFILTLIIHCSLPWKGKQLFSASYKFNLRLGDPLAMVITEQDLEMELLLSPSLP